MHAGLGALALGALRAPLDKPNVVVLFVDDLGYGDVGFNGHPTTLTPTIDALAHGGRTLSTWYSASPVCSASRASLLTGRQWSRMGIPGVFMPATASGMPLNESTLADELRAAGCAAEPPAACARRARVPTRATRTALRRRAPRAPLCADARRPARPPARYATGIVGKWHLGQRRAYLPAARGFDAYLGIPYSDDMGEARRSACDAGGGGAPARPREQTSARAGGGAAASAPSAAALRQYVDAGLAAWPDAAEASDPAASFLPLVSQRRAPPRAPGGAGPAAAVTEVVEQPLDLTTLARRYTDFALAFVDEHAARPFLLYAPFSHVHATAPNQPGKQYSGCAHANATRRGGFGDALAEVDGTIAALVGRLRHHGLEGNTLLLFAGDNGPDLYQGAAAGSVGLFAARHAGYWNVGKGSTWEGGIREAAFAYWPGVIPAGTRSAEVVSSMDVFPTVLALAGAPLPADRAIDGKDMRRVLLGGGRSEHEVLFFYGGAAGTRLPSAARLGPYKAHWATGPGLGGCAGCAVVEYTGGPLLFQVEHDPSEAYALTQNTTAPPDPALAAVVARFAAAYAREVAAVVARPSPPAPDAPGEGPGAYGVCCNRTLGCECDGPPA